MKSFKFPSAPTPGKSGPRPRQSATLRMVAREAGVSASTVSRIINGTVNVSNGLKHAARRRLSRNLDFRPNAAARGLALGRTLTIGVVAQAIDSPFYGEGLRGIEACLRQRGYAPLFMSGNWREEDEERCMREFIARGVDGIIVFAGRLSDARLKSYAKEVSIVVTGRRLRAPGAVQLADRRSAWRDACRAAPDRGSDTARSPSSPGRKIIRTRSKDSRGTKKRWGTPRSILIPSEWRSAIGTRKAVCGQRSNYSARKRNSPALFCVNLTKRPMAHASRASTAKGSSPSPAMCRWSDSDDLPSSAYRLPPLTSVRQSIRW